MNHDNTLARVPDFQKLLLSQVRPAPRFLRAGRRLGRHAQALGHRPAALPQWLPRSGRRRSRASTASLGFWFGPIGGYDQRQVRIATGKAEGMEITSNGQYLCIAGKNYSRLLSDTMLQVPKGIRRQLFQAGWHRLRLQRSRPRPPRGHLFRRSHRPRFHRHAREAARAGPQGLPQHHHQHLAEPLVAALCRHGLDGRRRFGLPSFRPHPGAAPERGELSRFGAIRRFRHPPGAVPHLFAR